MSAEPLNARAPEAVGAAVFSPCERYRYHLTRVWDETKGRCLFVMLNPSTATAEQDDPTIRRCIGYARTWGWGSLEVVNLFALRATDPKELPKQQKRGGVASVIGPDNDAAIVAAAERAGLIVMAYGNHGALFARDAEVLRLLDGRTLFCLGTAKTGRPLHPLYLSSNLKPVPFRVTR
jgi:hypothetical protein